ncbi:hypothetical protein DPMN_077099 [Dreissena polymorpha]|uniref:Uncharacterized protein n=1 Tax=Dreissena polymorpha TaxID=45954 RepID=A0A9D3YJV6_DREPO|nr:hypothetical protein DPMN_077099 [Dreissena polymorpha]
MVVIVAYTVSSAHHFVIAGYTKAPLTMNIIAGYNVSCANHGRYRGLKRKQCSA